MTVFPCKGSTTCAGYFGKQTWVYWTLLSFFNKTVVPQEIMRELKQRRRRRQRERQKSNRLRLAEQQLCTYITPFCTLLCRHCMATTWKCLISRIVKVVKTKQRLCFSFPELRHTLEFCSRKKKIASIWRIERDGISAIKFEAAPLHFVTDVFVAVAVVVAWFP